MNDSSDFSAHQRTIVPPPHKILVVDDDDMVRNVTIQALKVGGFIGVGYASGISALEQWSTEGPQFTAAVVDQTMPQLSGRELVAALRHEHKKLPIVFTSGYGASPENDFARNDPLMRFMKKPYSLMSFLGTLKEVILAARTSIVLLIGFG